MVCHPHRYDQWKLYFFSTVVVYLLRDLDQLMFEIPSETVCSLALSSLALSWYSYFCIEIEIETGRYWRSRGGHAAKVHGQESHWGAPQAQLLIDYMHLWRLIMHLWTIDNFIRKCIVCSKPFLLCTKYFYKPALVKFNVCSNH